MITELSGLKVGDEVLFDHFGSKDRRGKVVKITASAAHVEWTAPASGKTRVVSISFKERAIPAWDGYAYQPGATTYVEARSKNIRLIEKEAK